jgi:ferritin-like metal-binding protein YciE
MKNTTTTRENGQATKAKPGAAKGLHDLFVNELKDIYWAEKALTKAIPVMIKNATADELVEALTGHLEVTKEHVTRLDKVFSLIDEKAVAKKCEAMAGLIEEAKGIIEDTEEGMVRDAGIIAASQKAEHYEIASYGTLCSFAKTLGESEAAALLQETLDEEKEADVKLSEIAESFINMEAVVEDTDEESADRSAPKAKTARK